MFEQEYINVLNDYVTLLDTPYQEYLKSTCSDVSSVHKGYFSIDFVNGDYRLQRLSAQIDASNQEIDIQYQTADIDTMDSYEKCVKKH